MKKKPKNTRKGRVRSGRRPKRRTLRKKRAGRGQLDRTQIEELMRRGKERGFVTELEVLHFVPNAEENVEELEKLYRELEQQNIRVAETRGFFDVQIGRASCRERV